MLAIFNRSVWGTPALQIDPIEGKPLIQVLRGGWYYEKDRYGKINRDLPKKNHPHSDVGDAFSLFVGATGAGIGHLKFAPSHHYLEILRCAVHGWCAAVVSVGRRFLITWGFLTYWRLWLFPALGFDCD